MGTRIKLTIKTKSGKCRDKSDGIKNLGRVAPEVAIHSDGWRGYDGLVDVGYAKRFRVDHGANEFACGPRHINGIESFWSFAKRRLQKFNGVPGHTFYLHLKECEWRFNNRNANLYQQLLRLLRQHPI